MSNFKLLVDTNILIALEDPQPVQASLAELVRLSGEHGVGVFVDGANYDDVARDRDEARRQTTLSKLDKFQKLRGIPLPELAALITRFGAINSENDRSDARLLATLDAKAVDFLKFVDRVSGEKRSYFGFRHCVGRAGHLLRIVFERDQQDLPARLEQ